MNFRYKAYVQKILSVIPEGEKINYFFQKYITGSLPIPDEDFLEKTESVKIHFENFKKYSGDSYIQDCIYFEFGSGYDMVIPVSMSLFGFKKLICIDIRELVFPELINDSIRRLRKFKDKIKIEFSIRGDIPLVDAKNYKQTLKDFFRIEYIAPLDARKTGIENNSIDFILSNATMEHIPKNDLPDILLECHRILKPGGIMSNAIDYRDHWSFFDKSISVYNYLRFTDAEWKKLNPSIMYQNRMRHRDYMEIINDIGFEIIEEKPGYPDENELKLLKQLPLNEYYKSNYSIEELSIKSSMIVLKKL